MLLYQMFNTVYFSFIDLLNNACSCTRKVYVIHFPFESKSILFYNKELSLLDSYNFSDSIVAVKSMTVIGGSYWQGVWPWRILSLTQQLIGSLTSPGERSSGLRICHHSKASWNISAKMYALYIYLFLDIFRLTI